MLRSATFCVSVLSFTCAAAAGPLDPPAGPVGPSYKTLDEVKPGVPLEDTGTTITITSPGFYYLTENVSSTGTGILIQATGVTLDLNGYTVIGNISGNSNHHGIQVSPIVDDRPVTIRNGNVHRFSGDGLSVTSSLMNMVLEHVHISDCGGHGVDLAGNLTATDVTSIDNGGNGYLVEGEALLTRCVARSNLGNGFEVEAGTIRDCLGTGNRDSGFELGFLTLNEGSIHIADSIADGNADRGIYVNNNAVVTGCLAIDNGIGVQATRDVVIENCASRLNAQWGFLTGFNAAVTNCTAAENGGIGFDIGSGSGISNCGAWDNGAVGIETGLGCGVSDCGARGNGTAGFEIGAGSAVMNCGSTINGTDGFTLQSDVRIFQCTADGNGTDAAADPTPAGIRSVSDCIIDSCHVTDNDIGIVAASGTLTIRCSAAGNSTNYEFEAGAEYGAVITGTPGFVESNSFANISF
ncbi:MAG: right-handed parallel beta-helix repeat-containing protein [Planctomycetota bacterium]|nr:right-handed parallel beta-helix repeat-containing protein [Planctomycetota bacterium]